MHTLKIESTANPSIKKFVSNQFLVTAQSYEFTNIDQAKPSPLAQQLFFLPFVKTVYIAQNFVAVEKFNIVEWNEVETELSEQIEKYLNSGQTIVEETNATKKVPVSIYAESTPNPSVLKFVANKPLFNDAFEFKNIDDAKYAPLAQALFQFSYVKEIFMSENYISISKYEIVDWQEVNLELREFIRNFIEEGNELIKSEALSHQSKNATKTQAREATLDNYSQKIVDLLDEYVRPAVASDGGNIAFDTFDTDTKTVYVILQGACSGCPASTMTLKNGIETMLKEMLNDPEIKVAAING